LAKTVLVTGGAGFIGANYVEFHLERYPADKLIVFDKMTYAGRKENLNEFEPNQNFSFVQGDVCDRKAVDQAMKGVDRVIHFAAESHVDRSIEGQTEFLETNILGTYNLLEAAKKENVEKFLMISTDEVYGSVEEGSSTESDELKPRNPYSASKAAADRLAYSYFATFNLPVLVTRASNNYGPKQFPEKVVPLFITNLLRGKKVPLYGDGKNIRDWLYVKDHCSAVDTVINKGELGETYNVGGNCELQNVELTHIILEALGKGEEMIEYVKDRPGHDRRYSLDSSKLMALGWKPEHDFKQALQKTIDWYKENEAWWRPLVKT
jgi:dTDP-glucose 4,6-dehydratase